MSAGVQRGLPVKSSNSREVIVNFSAEAVKAPFLLRCGALLIDYIVVVTVPVVGLLLSRFFGFDGARLLNSELNNAGWLVAVLIGLCNLILLPMFSGQSLGKMLTGLRIVALDGNPASVKSLAFRQIFGYFLTAATAFVGFFVSVFSGKGRALHDYVAGTVVIYAAKRPRT